MIEQVKYHYSVANDKQVVRLVDHLLQEEHYRKDYELLYHKALSLRNLWREDESIDTLRMIIDYYPEKEAPKVELAIGYINLKLMEEAEQVLKEVLNANRGNLNAINNLIYINELRKKWQEVIALSEQHLEYDETDPTVWLTLSSAYDNLKQYKKSIEYAEKALSLSHEDEILQSMSHNNLGFTYSNMEDFGRAEYHLKRAIEFDENEAFSHNNLGWVMARTGRLDEGLKYINHSISLDDTNSYAFKNRAKIYILLKDNKRAKRDLLRAKELGYAELYDHEVNDLLREFS